MNKIKPLALIVLDGVGLSSKNHGNVVKNAYLPNLRRLWANYPHRELKAHGTAVGLPTDKDMGNSEVGHNALGSGQIYAQGALLVNQAIASGEIFQGECWRNLVKQAQGHTLHLMGLLSDGNVHSHIDHLKVLLRRAKEEGIKRVAVHALLDGRDVDAQSADRYVLDLEAEMAKLNDNSFASFIASGGGRMYITMDRYEADWEMVKRGWDTHVKGLAPQFDSALAAIEHYRQKDPKISDQYLGSFVIVKDGKPIGTIENGDAVLFFNFRGDRALEISRAFEADESFTAFERGEVPQVFYAGMLEYDGDIHIPNNYLVPPPRITNCLSEEMIKHGLRQFAVSETQKYGHVTYFWNGNRLEPLSQDLETWHEIPSDLIDFAKKPWMKAFEISEAIIEAMRSKEYDFIRANFANGDMVGHTGNYQAALIALETVDMCVGRLVEAADKYGFQLMILADHGNCDEMCHNDPSQKPCRMKTSHTLSPVPFILYGTDKVKLSDKPNLGLANIAATVADLLGFAPHPDWEESILQGEA